MGKHSSKHIKSEVYAASAMLTSIDSQHVQQYSGWNDRFRQFSCKVSVASGSPWVFIAAVFVIVAWAVSGPIFKYSDTWQLVINTGTTVITFLMVFLIQNTQNRDTKSIQIKLDELIRSVKGARNRLIDIENMSDSELEDLHKELITASRQTQEHIHRRHGKTSEASKSLVESVAK